MICEAKPAEPESPPGSKCPHCGATLLWVDGNQTRVVCSADWDHAIDQTTHTARGIGIKPARLGNSVARWEHPAWKRWWKADASRWQVQEVDGVRIATWQDVPTPATDPTQRPKRKPAKPPTVPQAAPSDELYAYRAYADYVALVAPRGIMPQVFTAWNERRLEVLARQRR